MVKHVSLFGAISSCMWIFGMAIDFGSKKRYCSMMLFSHLFRIFARTRQFSELS